LCYAKAKEETFTDSQKKATQNSNQSHLVREADMDKNLFDDLIASCNEVLAYRRGEIQLKTTTVEIPDDELEPSQLLF